MPGASSAPGATEEDWERIADTVFPGGSLGNGAAMRVAPVGLLFRDDLDRVAAEAERSARPTHRHPVGVDGAGVLALAVALAVRSGRPLDRAAFYGELLARAATDEFRWPLSCAAEMTSDHSVGVLGGGLEAHRSMAIACFTTCPESYIGAVARAIGVGDDVDTLAAMTGALSGAYHGGAGVPAHLIAALEDGPKGRSYITQLAGRLAALHGGAGGAA